MELIYGYIKANSRHQNTQKQIDYIKFFDNNAIIFQETEFNQLLEKVKQGDSIVFDEISRISQNIEECYNIYMELLNKGIDLIFLKERHIDTKEYQRRKERHFITGVDIELENLKDNIRLSLERTKREKEQSAKRIKKGKRNSKLHQGRPFGSKNLETEKASHIKEIIKNQSKDFQGSLSDVQIMKSIGIARNTFYKYKKVVKQEENMQNNRVKR